MRACLLLPLLLSTAPLRAIEYPVAPYVDAAQLDVPWPKHSFYKQPWRSYLETRSGYDFLNGIGVNLNLRGTPDGKVKLLADAGIRCARIEIGWGAVRWDESGVNDEARWLRLLGLCRQYGIRPILLLNAHQGVPCPVQSLDLELAAPAPAGSRTIRLKSIDGVEPGHTGPRDLSDYWAAEALITKLDRATGEATLSKPLPRALPAGKVHAATLKYLPLYPVGTPEYADTAAGWVRYARLIAQLVQRAGIQDFDLEIWNELTFGTRFLDVNNYYQPKLVTDQADFLHAGGRCWELARRTIDAVKADKPDLRVIWGFSNTTFYHTAIEQLPPRCDGQSYHPYGTGTRRMPQQEDRPADNLEGYAPTVELRLPEGWAQLFTKTESLMRLLNPTAREHHPPGTQRFHHYLTEHGVLPRECGVTDAAGAWALKAKAVLRAYCFWLNKGIDQLDWYCAEDAQATGFGLLPTVTPTEPDFERDATPPLQALRSLTRAFRGAQPLERTAQLDVRLTALGPQTKLFEGDRTHPPLWSREMVAVLPFQLDAKRVVVAAYVMTWDVRAPVVEERYRLELRGLPAAPQRVRWLDPLTRHTETPEALAPGVWELSLSDTPRLLILE